MLDDSSQSAHDILVVERLGLLAQTGERVAQLRAGVLGQLIGESTRLSELRVLGIQLRAAGGAALRDTVGPFDEVAEFAERFVEEREDGYRTELSPVQVQVHQIEMLIAQEYPHVEVAAVLGQATEDGQIVNDIAAPI